MLWALFCAFAPFAVAVWLCGLLEDSAHRAWQRDMDHQLAEADARWARAAPQPTDWTHIMHGFPQKKR